jgi:hypothetical protein
MPDKPIALRLDVGQIPALSGHHLRSDIGSHLGDEHVPPGIPPKGFQAFDAFSRSASTSAQSLRHATRLKDPGRASPLL